MRFFPDLSVDRIVRDRFTLSITRSGSDRLWAPFESPDGTVIALAGRVALAEAAWEAGARIEGPGGLACKAIYQAYREHGIEGVTRLSGGFAVHVFDPRHDLYQLVNDGGGVFPCYAHASTGEVICSHPDLLAEAMDGGNHPSHQSPDAWDLVSMAQFVSTGVVSFPHSYYRQIVALDFGCVHRFALSVPGAPARTAARFSNWQTERQSGDSEDTLAERLAEAIAEASRLRTLPILGRSAVALSGGLDSRSILCAAERHDELFAFCAFDKQNAEFRLAQAIADSLGVKLVPLERSFDHYADHAEAGVRISGGMGEVASNHFLGFRDRLRQLGIENLVTGCYFDYLFKSLALDSREAGILRREQFSRFSYQTYLPHFPLSPRYALEVRARQEALFPEADRVAEDSGARARNAMRRVFPLYHEGDNAQRLIPQRVLVWNPPAADPAIFALCRAIPPEMKLNKRIFRKAVQRICSEAVLRIPDANTGLPVSAPAIRVGINRYLLALRARLDRRRKRIATEESWPNWPYYIRTSAKLRELWQRPNPLARELIGDLCGEPFRDSVASYGDRPTQYFMRLLTLKLWIDQRVGQTARVPLPDR